jgi:hypothetical protein
MGALRANREGNDLLALLAWSRGAQSGFSALDEHFHGTMQLRIDVKYACRIQIRPQMDVSIPSVRGCPSDPVCLWVSTRTQALRPL